MEPKTPFREMMLDLRDTYATNLLNAGAERADLQALLGHSTLNTTPIDTHVEQDRMAAVARL